MTRYSTSDSRLAAYVQARGVPLFGTEVRYQGDDDRVHLLFDVEESKIAELKREFFEGASAPALELLNFHKATMFQIRDARELARNK